MSYLLPSLPYTYDAFEPFFDKKTMKIHHTKHHQTYIDNANSILEMYPELKKYTAEELMKHLDQIPSNKRLFMKNNIGGHINHSFFWKNLKMGTHLSGKLKEAIEHDFNNIKTFKEIFEKVAITHFGSGWVWLVLQNHKLVIVSTINQDNPLMGKVVSGTLGFPIIALDLWEHAYYLKYQNKKSDYIKAFWNIVNWEEASLNFLKQNN
ncbi:Superoxide dismutase [Mn] [Serratia symbiotica]|nr:Superoxide dismutase [Mn] [Serratia symbiotica]